MLERVSKEKRFWDRFAPRYDRFMSRFAGVYAQLVERIQPKLDSTDRVLEVATGTGLIALEISTRVSSVTAVDISEPMIHVARGKARSANIGNVDFQVQDACALSFDDQQFDVCLVVNALRCAREIRSEFPVALPGWRAISRGLSTVNGRSRDGRGPIS